MPLGLHGKQCRIFSIPEIRTSVIIYGQETSHDNTAVVIRAQILTVNGDSVSKSGFYLWGCHIIIVYKTTHLSLGPGKFCLVPDTYFHSATLFL